MGWGVSQSSVGLVGAEEPEAGRLPAFFRERGFQVSRWSTLVEASRLAGVEHALVAFADAFPPGPFVKWLELVRKADAARLVLVLTAAPTTFAGPTALKGQNVLVLVRPVLAWQLVDLIRHHVQRHVGGDA